MQPIVHFRDLGCVVDCSRAFNPGSLARNKFYELTDWSLTTFPSGLVLAYRHGIKLLGYDNNYNSVAAIVHFSEPHIIVGTEINDDLICQFYEKLKSMVKKVNDNRTEQYPNLVSTIATTPDYMLKDLEQMLSRLKPH